MDSISQAPLALDKVSKIDEIVEEVRPLESPHETLRESPRETLRESPRELPDDQDSVLEMSNS